MNANDNTITSFARELNPTGVGEHIYVCMYVCMYVDGVSMCLYVCLCITDFIY